MQQVTWKKRWESQAERVLVRAKIVPGEVRELAKKHALLGAALKLADRASARVQERFPERTKRLKKILKNPRKELYRLFNQNGHAPKHKKVRKKDEESAS